MVVCGSEAFCASLSLTTKGIQESQESPKVGYLWPLLHLLWWQGFAFLPGVLILRMVFVMSELSEKKKNGCCCPGYTGIPSRTWSVAHVSYLKAGLIQETTNRTQMLQHNTSYMIYQPFAHRNVLYEICWYHCRFQDVGVAHKRRHAQCTSCEEERTHISRVHCHVHTFTMHV